MIGLNWFLVTLYVINIFLQKALVHGKVQELYEYMTDLMFEDNILHIAMKMI